jgi:hypothetical protein
MTLDAAHTDYLTSHGHIVSWSIDLAHPGLQPTTSATPNDSTRLR